MPSPGAGMTGADDPLMVILRLCKAALVAAVGLFFFVVAMDNLTDYGSNFQFVQHVLSMDDTFPGNAEMWRAIPYHPDRNVLRPGLRLRRVPAFSGPGGSGGRVL